MRELLQAFFEYLWVRRPNDVDYRSSGSIQSAMAHLREQSRMTREEMSTRLGVNNSRLGYLEAHGNLTPHQLQILAGLADEYAMPNLAAYFKTKLVIQNHPHIGGDKKRGRRNAFNE